MVLSKEYIKFIFFLFIILILTYPLIDILTRSANTGIIEKITFEDNIHKISSTILFFIALIIGFYIGSLIILFLDRKKRIQVILLSTGISIILIYIIWFTNIELNIIYISLGIIIGAFLGYGNNYRNASRNISIFSVSYIILSFLNIYLSSPNDNVNNNIIIDGIIILMFSYIFGEVINYEIVGPKIFVLGPINSGKTLFLAGCYLRALDVREGPVKPSEDLLELVDQLHSIGKEWPARTKDINVYQFTYEIGKIFPKDTVFRTIDYPGFFIEKIFLYMDRDKIREMKRIKGFLDKSKIKDKIGDDIDKNKYNIIDNKEKEISEEELKYFKVAQEVLGSDKLIFILDGKKYPNFGEMGITHYIKIINKLYEEGKTPEYFLVVTKSDLFKNEYNTNEGNYKNEEDYDRFKKFIEEKFSKNIYLRQLLNEASMPQFYPVFYYTNNIDGIDIPIRDDNRNVYTFGFDKFMDDLIK